MSSGLEAVADTSDDTSQILALLQPALPVESHCVLPLRVVLARLYYKIHFLPEMVPGGYDAVDPLVHFHGLYRSSAGYLRKIKISRQAASPMDRPAIFMKVYPLYFQRFLRAILRFSLNITGHI